MNRAGKRKQTEIWLREGLGKEKEKTAAEMEKKERTVLLSVQAFRNGLSRKRSLKFRGLILRQVRYTGWMVWLWQAVVFLGIMAVYHAFFRTAEGTVDLFLYRRFQDFLCGAGILSAWSSVPVPVPVVPLEYGGGGGCVKMFHAASACCSTAPDRGRSGPDGRRRGGDSPSTDCGGDGAGGSLSGISISALWKLYPVFSQKKGSSLSVTGLQRSGCRAPGGFPGVEQDFSGDRI